jgi:mRNA-degrading endonuclease RelE of RelBE toxin-antitoxin system
MFRIRFTDEAARDWRKLDNTIKSGAYEESAAPFG